MALRKGLWVRGSTARGRWWEPRACAGNSEEVSSAENNSLLRERTLKLDGVHSGGPQMPSFGTGTHRLSFLSDTEYSVASIVS